MPFSGLPNSYQNDQASGLQQIFVSGETSYATNAYGAAFATTATITADLAKLYASPANGDTAFLYNTTDASKRGYVYMNNAWSYFAIT